MDVECLPCELWVQIFDNVQSAPKVALCRRLRGVGVAAERWLRTHRYVVAHHPLHWSARPLVPFIVVHRQCGREWRWLARRLAQKLLRNEPSVLNYIHLLATLLRVGDKKACWSIMTRLACKITHVHHAISRYLTYAFSFNARSSAPAGCTWPLTRLPRVLPDEAAQALKTLTAYVMQGVDQPAVLLDVYAAALCMLCPQLLPHVLPPPALLQTLHKVKLPDFFR